MILRALGVLAASGALLAPGLLQPDQVDGAGRSATATRAAVPSQATDDAFDAVMELVGQQFAIDPNGDLRLDYLLTGLVDDPLELIPPPPAEPTPEPEPAPDDTGTVPAPEPSPEPPPPPVALTLEITNYQPLTDPADVDRVVGSGIDTEATGVVGSAIDGVAIDARPLLVRNDDGTVELPLVVATDVTESTRDRLKFEQPGLYPIRVQLLIGDPADDDVIATASTVVQRLAGAVDLGVVPPPPIDLSVVAVTPEAPPGATPDELGAANAELDRALDLAAQLDAPVTLEVPPTLIAERASTPAAADRLAETLADDELVALPVVPLDVSAAVAAGRGDSYTRFVRAGEDLLTDAVPTVRSVRDVWITTEALSGPGAQHLRDLGRRVVIMPAELYASTVDADVPPTDRLVEAQLPDGGTLALLVADPIAEQLTPAATDRILQGATAVEWSVATLGRLLVSQQLDDALVGAPSPRRSIVLTTPELSSPDPRLLRSLEQLATTTTSFRFTAASSLIGVTDVLEVDGEPAIVELPTTAGPSLSARVELLDRTAIAMASVSTMLPADDPRPELWQVELDTLISTAYSDAEVEVATDELIEQATGLKDAVQLPAPFTFTLTGRSGTIEIRVVNDADEPLDVVVELASEKVDFPEGPQQVTLRPRDETSVIVPVEAQSNGTSSIALSVATPAGEVIGSDVDLTARVTAFTGLGQVLTGGLIVVILTWWFSHWRSRRRAALVGGRERRPSNSELESESL